MEDPQDRLGDYDLRQLWTRFEGLVGHQLYRLRSDDEPVVVAAGDGLPPHSKAGSSRAVRGAACSSSLCSMLTSEISSPSLSLSSSPVRLEEESPTKVTTAGSAQLIADTLQIGCSDRDLGSPVDPEFNRPDEDVDADVDGGGGDGEKPEEEIDKEREEEIEEEREKEIDAEVEAPTLNIVDCADKESNGVIGTTTSCLLLLGDESEISHSVTSNSDGSGQAVMRRNASANALNTSEAQDTQPLFGLPYVARAVGPLLSLTMVTLEEWEGMGRAQPADTVLKLEQRRRECTRSMIGVYKQSLLLESQLHQYLNPGLVTSLNRRVARATFEAEAMVTLIDKLRKESKKSVLDIDRRHYVVELSTKLKSLLGRQKCEWQCVGRLKETLTMAREMKELLRFIARLSNILERSKSALGGLQERPPPYEYCSPFTEFNKTIYPAREHQGNEGGFENQPYPNQDAIDSARSSEDPDDLYGSKKTSPIMDKFIDSAMSDPGPQSSSDHDGRSPCLPSAVYSVAQIPMRGRAQTHTKRRPVDLSIDSCSSAKPFGEHSTNSNDSRATVPDSAEEREGRPRWLAKNPVKKPEETPARQLRFLSTSTRSSVQHESLDDSLSTVEKGHAIGEKPVGDVVKSGRQQSCKTTNDSPPRACPRNTVGRKSSPKRKRQKKCQEDLSSPAGKKRNNARWDGSTSRRNSKAFSDEEVRGINSDQEISAGSQSSGRNSKPPVSGVSRKGKQSASPMSPKSKASLSPNRVASPTQKSNISQVSKRTKSKGSHAGSEGTGMGGGGGGGGAYDDGMEDPLLDACGGSDGSPGSDDDVFIDIQQECANECNKNQKSPSSCPQACWSGCRRIRVKVRRPRSGSESPRAKGKPGDVFQETPEEAEPIVEDDAPMIGHVTDEENSNSSAKNTVQEDRISGGGSAERLLSATPSKDSNKLGRPSPKATPSPKPSPRPQSTSSKVRSITSRSTQLSCQSEADQEDENQEEECNWRSFLRSLARMLGLPESWVDDEPWKLLLPAALLLLLLLYLLSMLFSSCCGCGYFPNPLFYFTNSLAQRVRLRHYGPAPI